jgi:hypothetical protein
MFLSDAIKQKALPNTFKKYFYRCNGMLEAVYCKSIEDFRTLVNQWNRQSQIFCHNKYIYTAESHGGFEMDLYTILSDLWVKEFSTEGSRVLKMYLHCPYTGVAYIS